MRQQQMLREIWPFLRRSDKCKSALLRHRALMAGQRSSRGLLQWSRLGKRCTQAPCPRPSGAALRPFPRPMSVIWCLVCLWWCSCDKGGRCVVLQELRLGAYAYACLHRINDAGRTAPRPFCTVAPHSTQRTPHIACDRHRYQQQCAKKGAGQQRWRTPYDGPDTHW